MFRYLARHHDRKHIKRSLQRQEQISKSAIGFAHDTSLAFAVNEPVVEDGDHDLAVTTLCETEAFFTPLLPAEPIYQDAHRVIFESDIKTSDEKNNVFECVVTESGAKDHALVVFHHWYSRNRYTAFSRYFAKRGMTVVEATLPYHFSRGSNDRSEEQLFNASIGRTVRSMRQAVLDGRKIVRWLKGQRYRTVYVVGMCLGGTVAGLVAAQEEKVDKAVLMVTPPSPADLIWTSETMQRLKGRIEPSLSLEDLRKAWTLINLDMHTFWLSRPELELLFVQGKRDTIARPERAHHLIHELTSLRGRPPELLQLDCGHSSIGMFPYNIIAARKVMRFLMEIPTLKELGEVRNFRIDLSGV